MLVDIPPHEEHGRDADADHHLDRRPPKEVTGDQEEHHAHEGHDDRKTWISHAALTFLMQIITYLKQKVNNKHLNLHPNCNP